MWIYAENIITISALHVVASTRSVVLANLLPRNAPRSLASFIAQYAHKSATFRAGRHDLLAPRSANICRHLTHPLYLLSLLAAPSRTYNSMTTADLTRPNLCLTHIGFHQTAVRAVKYRNKLSCRRETARCFVLTESFLSTKRHQIFLGLSYFVTNATTLRSVVSSRIYFPFLP